jgi:hypothetical protein
MPAPQFYEGQTATDPKTNKQIVWGKKSGWTPFESPAKAASAQNAQYMLRQITRAQNQSGLLNTGLFGFPGMLFPGSETKKLEATIAPIKSNISFDTLQEIRKNSPTGGALGPVSDKDIELLASKIGSLDVGQGEKQLDRSLADIQETYKSMLTRLGYNPQGLPERTNPGEKKFHYDKHGNRVGG